MKKLKLLSSLSSVAVLTTTIPFVATACNEKQDKTIVTLDQEGNGCKFTTINNKQYLAFSSDDTSASINFTTSAHINDAKFDLKIQNEVYQDYVYANTNTENTYTIAFSKRMISQIIDSRQEGVHITIFEQNNEVEPISFDALAVIWITDVTTEGSATIDKEKDPYEVTYNNSGAHEGYGMLSLTSEPSDNTKFVLSYAVGSEVEIAKGKAEWKKTRQKLIVYLNPGFAKGEEHTLTVSSKEGNLYVQSFTFKLKVIVA